MRGGVAILGNYTERFMPPTCAGNMYLPIELTPPPPRTHSFCEEGTAPATHNRRRVQIMVLQNMTQKASQSQRREPGGSAAYAPGLGLCLCLGLGLRLPSVMLDWRQAEVRSMFIRNANAPFYAPQSTTTTTKLLLLQLPLSQLLLLLLSVTFE